MKKPITLITAILIIIFLSSCYGFNYILEVVADVVIETLSTENTEEHTLKTLTEIIETSLYNAVGNNAYITRAEAARMLALTQFSRHFINNMQSEISFADVISGTWQHRYVNAIVASGLMAGGGDMFFPDDNLTMLHADILLSRLFPGFETGLTHSDEPIPYSLWVRLFAYALHSLSGGDIGNLGMEIQVIAPIHTTQINVFTANGSFAITGFDFQPYIDVQISAITKDGAIIALFDIIGYSFGIQNAYIVNVNNGFIYIFAGGALRTFIFEDHSLNGTGGFIADITIHNGKVTSISNFDNIVAGTVKRVTANITDLGDYGTFLNHSGFVVYDFSGGERRIGCFADIISGSTARHVHFISDGTYVRAAIINDTPDIIRKRVVLHNQITQGYHHESVTVTSNVPFLVWSRGAAFRHEPGQAFTVNPHQNQSFFTEERPRIFIVTDAPGGFLTIESLERYGGHNPTVRGILEIAQEPDGSFTIINDISVEDYIAGVVASIPNISSLEESRLWAVIARTFTVTQFYANAFHRYGAHVDDTVHSQLYAAAPLTQISDNAARDTRGLVLASNGNIALPTIFAVSAGVTANAGDVWPNVESAAHQHINSLIFHHGQIADLTIEANAKAFFQNTDIVGYDSYSPWFRWNVFMTARELTISINSVLSEISSAHPGLVTVLEPCGRFLSRAISSVGDVVGLEVLRRGNGGVILTLLIIGSENTIIVHTESLVRQIISPIGVVINLQGDGTVTNLPNMPSAFFALDINIDESGELNGVTFFGGGYGHGAGMSVTGMRTMIENGDTFHRILRRYFNGAVVMRAWR
ncbi:MAG: S-layer homology domain-containing protein [Defluviitaleaceae bacterium]|nr:S-layer homology domain-containing protein [Defluviitaleaceae bacterium]